MLQKRRCKIDTVTGHTINRKSFFHLQPYLITLISLKYIKKRLAMNKKLYVGYLASVVTKQLNAYSGSILSQSRKLKK